MSQRKTQLQHWKLNKQKRHFSVKDKSHQEKSQLQTKKPVFVKDKFHQEKSQQTKKPFFVKDKSNQKEVKFKQKRPFLVKDGSHYEKSLSNILFLFDQSGNGVFDHVTKCLEFHPESPHKCKNSSWRV